MSFDAERGYDMIESKSPEQCQPDYEAQAENMKEKLDSTKNLEIALFDFAEKNTFSRFRKISSITEMIGGLTIIKKEQTNTFERLLKQIEDSK